jgi:hypothetical protein
LAIENQLLPNWPCWHTDDDFVWFNLLDNHGPSTNDRSLTNRASLYHSRTHTNMHAWPDLDTTTKNGTRGNMDMVSEFAVMFNNGTGVD